MIKKAFQNETESIQIDELTIENRLDRVSIYGNIQLTADLDGYQNAIALHGLLSNVLAELEKRSKAGTLPQKIETINPISVKNPLI